MLGYVVRIFMVNLIIDVLWRNGVSIMGRSVMWIYYSVFIIMVAIVKHMRLVILNMWSSMGMGYLMIIISIVIIMLKWSRVISILFRSSIGVMSCVRVHWD